MGRTVRPAVLAHLDADKLAALNKLSAATRIPRSVLLREAVDDLLTKHKAAKVPRRAAKG